MDHPLTVRLMKRRKPSMADPRSYEPLIEAEADDLGGALLAVKTMVEDDGQTCDMIQINLAPGYRFLHGVLQYSAQWR